MSRSIFTEHFHLYHHHQSVCSLFITLKNGSGGGEEEGGGEENEGRGREMRRWRRKGSEAVQEKMNVRTLGRVE